MKIIIKNSVLRIGDSSLLGCPDLIFSPGIVHCMKGRSGSGKTSFLRAISGTSRPVSGLKVEFYQGEGGIFRPKFGRDIVFLQQSAMLWGHLTAFQNSWLPWAVQTGLTSFFGRRTLSKERAAKWCERLELDSKLLGKNSTRLSGGEKQRINLSSVLVFDPPCILLDEPTSNLDFLGANRVGHILEEQAAQGKLVIVTTHDEELINRKGWRHLSILPAMSDDHPFRLIEE